MLNRRSLAGIATAAAAAVLTTAGCSGEPPSMTAGPTAAAQPANGAHLGATEFAAAAKRPGTILLDVRTPGEFDSGHLEGAINIDVNGNFAEGIAKLDPTKPYAVYCRSGSRSKAAMDQMIAKGFTQTYDLSGGINSWTLAGGAVVRS